MPEANLFPKPARLSWEEAASMSLAGLTAYRALFSRGGLVTGETVLVLGAGSGVSTFVVQLAAQAGARVLVTSSSDEKIERSRVLGAEGGVNYATGDWVAEDAPTSSSTPSARRGRNRSSACDRAGDSLSSAPPAAPRPRCRCARSTQVSSRCSAR